MRVPSGRRTWAEEIRNRIERLECLPLRPLTARLVLKALLEPGASSDEPGPEVSPPRLVRRAVRSGRNRPAWEIDPGWMLGREIAGERHDPLASIAGRPWWTAPTSDPASEALQQLWRHSVAAALAARWLARDANDPAPDRVASAALLHNLGLWAVSAADPEWLVRWRDEPDPALRLRRERGDLGEDLTDLGRRLADRWGCPKLVIDAAWLHSPRDLGLRSAAANPGRIALIQEAVRWAEMTPGRRMAAEPEGPRDRDWDHPSADPRLRILVAEVQSRCGTPFIAPDATQHEERMTRQNASLRLRLAEALEYRESCDRFLTAFGESDPAEPPRRLGTGRRAGLVRRDARHRGPGRLDRSRLRRNPDTDEGADGLVRLLGDGRQLAEPAPPSTPSLILPLGERNRPLGEILLGCDGSENSPIAAVGSPIAKAWDAWAVRVADRSDLERRFRQSLQAHREGTIAEETRVRQLKIDALAEFAAGAGHEINNPLAVIVGRSQLLLAHAADPEQARSLRIIMAQAQRAHRILRDLMFFARPPAPRLRPCRPAELLRSCVADFQDESAARGVDLSSEIDGPAFEIHADADALRHLAEILIRNAIQATPAGGKVLVKADASPQETRWSIADSGPGISAAEGVHLFDPFYCGRQAGRGLGLGLPRAARIVNLAGGQLRWSASPGHGATFQVHLPRNPVPRPTNAGAAGDPAHDRPAPLPIP